MSPDNTPDSPNRQLELVEHDAASGRQQVLVKCQLQADGTVTLSGDDKLVARLQNGVFSPAKEGLVTPTDGHAFLDAVRLEFRSLYLFAREAE